MTGMLQGLAWAVSDTLAITRRNLLHWVRVPQLIVFSTIQPVMFVLLFTFVFGGAISGTRGEYVDYLLPGIIVQSVLFGSTQTGVGLADDLGKGFVDRLRALPMSRAAVLTGRTLADLTRSVFVATLMIVVGLLIGFRFHGSPTEAVSVIALAAVFGYAFNWVSAAIALVVRDAETMQVAGFVWLFPLVFASSIFVPTRTMPAWLEAFADANPVSAAANALRALAHGGEWGDPVVRTLLWTVAILAIAVPVAVHQYRTMT